MIKPLFNNVVIEQEEVEEKATESGIILPTTAQEKPSRGKVIASASDEVKAGQVVYFKKWGGSEVEVDGKDYIIIEDVDILAVV